jgi:hypothetical protein
MSMSNVKSAWEAGNLVFRDKSGDVIATFDGASNIFAVGAALTVAGVTVDATTLAADEQTAGTVATVANVNIVGGIPILYRITATALTGDVDVVLTYKSRVLDVWCVGTAAGGAGDTITVKNGSTAITNAIDMNVSDKVLVRAGTIDDAQHEIDAAGTLKISGASGVTCEVYVLAIRVA